MRSPLKAAKRMEGPAEDKPSKKRVRQASLEECFGFAAKRKKSAQEEIEGLNLEDVASMSACPRGEETSDQKRRREQIAAAAERRRASQSPDHPGPTSPTTDLTCPGISRLSPDTSLPAAERAPGNSPPAVGVDAKRRDAAATGNGSGGTSLPFFAYLEGGGAETAAATSAGAPSRRTTRRGLDESAPSTSATRDDRPTASTNRETPKTRPDRSHRMDPGSALRHVLDGDDDDEEKTAAGIATGDVSPTLEYESSLPLFSDSEPRSSQEGEVSSIGEGSAEIAYRGVRLSELNRSPACCRPLPTLTPSSTHTVLFRPHIRSGTPPRPYPDTYRDAWDAHHVRMPCSAENLYPVEDKNGQKMVQSRWELIETTLLSPIQSSWDLEEAILTYNARYCSKWNFAGLHHFFAEEIDSREAKHFFDNLLPKMVELALMLPKICTQPIPLLKRQRSHTITLSQLQIASLLANAFFCTFPRRNAQQKKSEYSRFPDIHFNRLFEGSGRKSSTNQRKTKKLRCIINYFRRVASSAPTGTVSFVRRSQTTTPDWQTSTNTLTRFHGNVKGMIEDEGEGMLQLDFANMYIGGGVLGHGLVQEEIRFLICPELIVSRLFTEVLDANECLIIKGAERFSDYTGYAGSFQWTGDYQDKIPRDSWGRKETEILAIDALVFRCLEDQFKPQLLQRELNKAFCGFHGDGTPHANLSAVATGNWGCGAFGGDTKLKGLLQMMVAAECRRDLAYFTFGDRRLCYELHKMNEFLVSQGVTVADLWNVLQRYRKEVLQRKAKGNFTSLYTFIYQVYNDFNSSTDEEEEEEERKEGEEEEEEEEEEGEAVSKASSEDLSPNYKVDTP